MRAVNCWNCKERIVLDDSFEGQEIRCQNCTSLVKVPEAGSGEAEAGEGPEGTGKTQASRGRAKGTHKGSTG